MKKITFALPALLIAILCVSSPAEARKKKNPALEAAKTWLDEKLVKPPVDGEVCFSPDEPCDIKLTKFIQSAQKSIDIAIFDINLDKLVHEVLVASRRIPVRIVVDRRQAKGNHSLVPLLIKAGAQVRYGRQRGVMHNKFTLIDGERLQTGSFNYTNNGSRNNQENQIYLGSASIVERYRARFEQIWESSAFPN